MHEVNLLQLGITTDNYTDHCRNLLGMWSVAFYCLRLYTKKCNLCTGHCAVLLQCLGSLAQWCQLLLRVWFWVKDCQWIDSSADLKDFTQSWPSNLMSNLMETECGAVCLFAAGAILYGELQPCYGLSYGFVPTVAVAIRALRPPEVLSHLLLLCTHCWHEHLPYGSKPCFQKITPNKQAELNTMWLLSASDLTQCAGWGCAIPTHCKRTGTVEVWVLQPCVLRRGPCGRNQLGAWFFELPLLETCACELPLSYWKGRCLAWNWKLFSV